MKKDKEWLKRQLEQMNIGWEESHPEYHRACGEALRYVNQLDEPEITEEQAWNKIAETYPADARSLVTSFQHFYYGDFIKKSTISKKESVEKEKLYKVELPIDRIYYILTVHGDNSGHFFGKEHTNNSWYRTYLTEQEIKAIDERYWAFAEEVTE